MGYIIHESVWKYKNEVSLGNLAASFQALIKKIDWKSGCNFTYEHSNYTVAFSATT